MTVTVDNPTGQTIIELTTYQSRLGDFLWPGSDVFERHMSGILGELEYKFSDSLKYEYHSIKEALLEFEPQFVVKSSPSLFLIATCCRCTNFA